MSLRDFVLPGLRDVMTAERAVLEVCTSQPFDLLHMNIRYYVNFVIL